MKKFLQKLINFFGYKISKIKTIEKYDLDKMINYINKKNNQLYLMWAQIRVNQ